MYSGASGRVYRAGWVYRVGIRVGNTGVPSQPACSRSPPADQRPPGAGPACRAGWVGCRVGGRTGDDGGRDGSQDHPAGPLQPPGPPLSWDPQNAHLRPKGRHFTLFTVKLVKTTKCHRNMSKRPVILPVSKNGPKSHLLKFSGFHFREPSLTRN